MPRHPPNALNLLENAPCYTDQRNPEGYQGRVKAPRTAFCINPFGKPRTHGTFVPDLSPERQLNAIQPSKIPAGLDVGAPKDARHTNGGWFRKVCIICRTSINATELRRQ